MNKIQAFAAALKARKNPRPRTGRNDPPAPASPIPRNGDPAGASRLNKVRAELVKANARADRAEAALAAVEKVKAENAKVHRLNQELARIRHAKEVQREIEHDNKLAAKLRESGRVNMQLNGRYSAAQFKLNVALKRIEELEAENQKLRSQIKGESA